MCFWTESLWDADKYYIMKWKSVVMHSYYSKKSWLKFLKGQQIQVKVSVNAESVLQGLAAASTRNRVWVLKI